MFHVLAGRKKRHRVGGQRAGVLLCNKQQLNENICGHHGLGNDTVAQDKWLLDVTGTLESFWARSVDEGEEAWLSPHRFVIPYLIFCYSFVSFLCSFVIHANLLFYYLWRWLHNTIKEEKSTFPACWVVLALLAVFRKSVFN